MTSETEKTCETLIKSAITETRKDLRPGEPTEWNLGYDKATRRCLKRLHRILREIKAGRS